MPALRADGVPFYIYYSMFGYQRVGDLVWAAADRRTRGFMLGGTAGRTTLNGEGLRHGDGHSHVLFSVVPNCRAYGPTFGYEVAVIIQDGLRRMFVEQEDVFYHLTLLNEDYPHPPMADGAQEGILRGMYLLQEGSERSNKPRVQLLGSGAILREVVAAAELLANDFDGVADVWSVRVRRGHRWTLEAADDRISIRVHAEASSLRSSVARGVPLAGVQRRVRGSSVGPGRDPESA